MSPQFLPHATDRATDILGAVVGRRFPCPPAWVHCFNLLQVEMPEGRLELFNILQAFESEINDIVFTGIGIIFLVTLENRIKRGRAVRALHELRSIAHVIDMYQLTKARIVLPDVSNQLKHRRA